MPSISWMLHGVSTDSSISKNPTESIAGNHRGSSMHGAGGFKASWDKWCGMDVRIGNFFPPVLSGLCFLKIDRSLVYIFCHCVSPDIFWHADFRPSLFTPFRSLSSGGTPRNMLPRLWSLEFGSLRLWSSEFQTLCIKISTTMEQATTVSLHPVSWRITETNIFYLQGVGSRKLSKLRKSSPNTSGYGWQLLSWASCTP